MSKRAPRHLIRASDTRRATVGLNGGFGQGQSTTRATSGPTLNFGNGVGVCSSAHQNPAIPVDPGVPLPTAECVMAARATC